MHSNKYITVYTVAMTLIVSVVLAIIVTGLRPAHEANEAVFKKRDIMSAIKNELPVDLESISDQEVLSLFNERIEQVTLDANGQTVEGVKAETIDMAKEEKKPEAERLYPMYIYKGEKATFYLVSVRGNGLWDKIWGTIALQDDFNTIAGVSFDHVTETAGLGAEIKDSPAFKQQFVGKKIYNDNNEFVSVAVVKGGIKKPEHQVDAIAGATITSNGVTEMMENGLEVYLPYFESKKNK